MVFTIALIVGGAAVMALAIAETSRLLRLLDEQTGLRSWQVLVALMVFFLLGYAGTAGIVAIGDEVLLQAMTGLVFFFGSVFVLVVVRTGHRTVEQLAAREAGMHAQARQLDVTVGRLAAVVDNIVDGLIAVDPERRIELVNPAGLRLFELDADPEARAVGALPEAVRAVVDTALSGEDVAVEEIVLPGGRLGVAVASPIRTAGQFSRSPDGAGELGGAVVLVRDVTLQREIDRMKSDFAATVSHELRTPLTSVLGFARIVSKKLEGAVFPLVPADDRKAVKAMEQVRGNLDIIVAEGTRLTALINDVLDISKMEAGQVDWRMAEVAPEELVQRSLDATRALFAEKASVQLVREVQPDLPRVSADADRMIQVLINLFSNALKFTDSGRIVVGVAARDGAVEFSVEDSGVGIRPSDRERVFERFQQVGDTMTDRPKGTGLGLPICREIVNAHGGRIWVEGTRGQGSRFLFTVPTPATT